MLWCPTELLRSAQCLVSSQPFSIVTRNAEIWGGYSKLCLTPSQVWFYCSSYGLTPVLPDCLTAVNKIFDAATALDNNREMWRELSEWLCIVLTLGHATHRAAPPALSRLLSTGTLLHWPGMSLMMTTLHWWDASVTMFLLYCHNSITAIIQPSISTRDSN